jgi:GMP synthase (glutamine-hydrolysing)
MGYHQNVRKRNPTIKMDKIIVLDFGSQYSHLICRRVRDLNVYCELLPYDTSIESIKLLEPKGIIFSGGPASVYSLNSPKPDKQIYTLGVPILGICYGHQLIVTEFSGAIKRSNRKEFGYADLNIDDDKDLFKGIKNNLRCWMSHADAATRVPSDFNIIAHTNNSDSAAIANRHLKIYGLQFHPEVVHTENGNKILENFSKYVSKANGDWTMTNFVKSAIEEIRNKVREEKILCAVSGGIDSTTLAVLLSRAVKDNLHCIFVNNGLLRLNEEKSVPELFKKYLKINLTSIDASKEFLVRLKGISDPESKRKIIGSEFAKVFVKVAEKQGPFKWLAQGTLYPDVIESGVSKGPASIIKTHHNVGGLPEWLNLKVIEPFRYLYKDEVKKIANLLRIPKTFLKRHPFPGPGLAVRIIGQVSSEKIKIAREASSIVEEELKKCGWYDKVWQAYAAVGDDLAVGVLGDERVYGHIVIVKIVESYDAMTADWSRVPYDILGIISRRITNEVEGVTWVTYAVSSKPPATIEPQ